jgi:hypothetical protein
LNTVLHERPKATVAASADAKLHTVGERFKGGTKGRRKRRLEASDNLLGTLVAGSFRNGNFSSSETGGYRPTNWIEKLNQAVANEVDQAHWNREKRKWPVDVMGCARHSARRPAFTVEAELRRTIIETEWLLKDEQPSSHLFLGDDIQLEYYEDGCPMLPTCLARRPPTRVGASCLRHLPHGSTTQQAAQEATEDDQGDYR